MAKDTAIPDTFEGAPTKYELFDGYRTASPTMQTVYLVSAFVSAMIVPIYMEFAASNEADKNRSKAQSYYAAHPEENPLNKPSSQLSRGHSHGHEMNPDAPQDGRHAVALNTQQPASVQR